MGALFGVSVAEAERVLIYPRRAPLNYVDGDDDDAKKFHQYSCD